MVALSAHLLLTPLACVTLSLCVCTVCMYTCSLAASQWYAGTPYQFEHALPNGIKQLECYCPTSVRNQCTTLLLTGTNHSV